MLLEWLQLHFTIPKTSVKEGIMQLCGPTLLQTITVLLNISHHGDKLKLQGVQAGGHLLTRNMQDCSDWSTY